MRSTQQGACGPPARRESLPGAIPASIRDSPLLRRGGFDVFVGLLDDRSRHQMLSEAAACFAAAEPSDVPVSDGEEIRGGSPARRFLSAAAGEVQAAFYRAPWMLAFLRKVAGTSLGATGDVGTYTYYIRAGDHLTVHRDVELCDVAVITCLYDAPEPTGVGGMLSLYPDRLSEPLSQIRATPQQGAVRLRLSPGQTIVMFGGLVPHALLPITDGQARIVSVLCYQVLR